MYLKLTFPILKILKQRVFCWPISNMSQAQKLKFFCSGDIFATRDFHFPVVFLRRATFYQTTFVSQFTDSGPGFFGAFFVTFYCGDTGSSHSLASCEVRLNLEPGMGVGYFFCPLYRLC